MWRRPSGHITAVVFQITLPTTTGPIRQHRQAGTERNDVATCRGDSPALTPAEAGTRFSDPGGMQG